MRRSVPENKVKCNYRKVIDTFITNVLKEQPDNIVSIYLEGSYARGDANDQSDVDFFIICNTVNKEILYCIGNHVRFLADHYDGIQINPQCMDVFEFDHEYFNEWSKKLVIALNSVLLFGKDLGEQEQTIQMIENIYKKALVEVLMGIRHYMSVDKPIEKLTHQRICMYVLKPLMFALRLERFCTLADYPLSINDLLNSYSDHRKLLIEYFIDKEKFDSAIKEDHKQFFDDLHTCVRSMIIEKASM